MVTVTPTLEPETHSGAAEIKRRNPLRPLGIGAAAVLTFLAASLVAASVLTEH